MRRGSKGRIWMRCPVGFEAPRSMVGQLMAATDSGRPEKRPGAEDAVTDSGRRRSVRRAQCASSGAEMGDSAPPTSAGESQRRKSTQRTA